EQVADAIGGADALLAVLEDSADGADGILSIAKVLHDEGRDEEALGRLERGMDERRSDPRLRSLAARSHHAAGRTERAGELLCRSLVQAPATESPEWASGAEPTEVPTDTYAAVGATFYGGLESCPRPAESRGPALRRPVPGPVSNSWAPVSHSPHAHQRRHPPRR